MKKIHFFTTVLLICFGISLISCGISKNKSTAEGTKSEKAKNVQQWLDAQSYEVNSDFAMPMNTAAVSAVLNSNILGPGNNSAQINLIGNPNFVKIKGDSIYAGLPYFGERRMGGGYNSREMGITVKGLIQDYKTNTKNEATIVTFNADDTQGNENYNFILNIFPNQNVSMSVNSTQRTTIQYRGTIRAIEEKPETKK
ncbi:DUF4251 domain-containing protein [Flavimarina sp. Hel_I_48]|uniref:DUF4251 domain-containing protein n=1 Tax=Flavimarina sp. Hel_I_48 TaxID=1392488 RepID=UPI0009DF1D8A|nr:DUF4251 domain-containing protein [Flavimarina sp. Hel_I_48]